MLKKVLVGITLLTSLSLLIIILMFKIPNNNNGPAYAEVEYSIYKVSNQCIADYYFDDLTEDGSVFSRYSIISECNGIHLQDSIVKIYSHDGVQQAQVNSYRLHGLLIKLEGNAIFMNKVILRRLDNNKIIDDITEKMRKDLDNISYTKNTSV